MDTKLSSRIWSNVEFDRATAEGKLAALWLITNEHVDMLGYADLSERRFIFETQLSLEALNKGFEALNKGCVRVHKGYWLRNFIQYQVGRGPSLERNNYSKGIIRALHCGVCEEVGRLVLEEYPELCNVEGFISPWKGLGKGLRGSLNHKRREEKRGEEKNSEGGVGETNQTNHRPPDVAAVVAYSQAEAIAAPDEVCADFFDHFEANGWRQGGRTPLRDWHAAFRNWIRRRDEFARRDAPKNLSGSSAAAEPRMTFQEMQEKGLIA